MLVSIITSVYNSQKTLEASVNSILTQTFEDFEFIIIDDGSTDSSLSIVNRLKREDNRIKLIKNSRNIGLTKSLNKALKVSKGKYIARHDADDISHKSRIEKQIDFLEANNIFLTGTSMNLVDENALLIKKARADTGITFIAKKMKQCNAFYHPTIMFRNKSGYFYRDKFVYAQDYDLTLRFLSDELKMDNLDEVLVDKCLTETSIGETKTLQQMLFAQKAKEFYWQRVKNGKDDYDKFDNTSILKRTKPNNKEEYEMLIKNAFGKRQMAKCRRLIKEYNRHYNERAFGEYKYLSYLPKPVLEKTINLVRTYGI